MADPGIGGGPLLLTTQPDMDDVARATVEAGTTCCKPLLFVHTGGAPSLFAYQPVLQSR